ncbi:apoptosis regulator BAX-like [Saccoglossus kowalevskii]|uniref:Apoptosis regulator BAX-like n=1 Tax=Saccoglossus kowalevskii TaxID=10224 RepID=A0ABM0MQ82_SACKO|nr:PREDICTED: apoptosis regulator BAX-like [Saccoglossus kowalevskii]
MAEGGPPDEYLREDEGAVGGAERQQSQEQDVIGAQATQLLMEFIIERFQRDGIENAPTMEEIQDPDVLTPMQEENWGQIGATLRTIADEMDRDYELQRMIDRVPTNCSVDAVIAVARVIFDDGIVNWGRVVALFYFAYRMCVKAINSMMSQYLPGWMTRLIREIVKFLVEVFAAWIISRGGWGAIIEYLGSPAWQFYSLCAISFTCFVAAVVRMNWR